MMRFYRIENIMPRLPIGFSLSQVFKIIAITWFVLILSYKTFFRKQYRQSSLEIEELLRGYG